MHMNTHVSPKKILLIYRFKRWQFVIIDRYVTMFICAATFDKVFEGLK
jgi:hypothetical protein